METPSSAAPAAHLAVFVPLPDYLTGRLRYQLATQCGVQPGPGMLVTTAGVDVTCEPCRAAVRSPAAVPIHHELQPEAGLVSGVAHRAGRE